MSKRKKNNFIPIIVIIVIIVIVIIAIGIYFFTKSENFKCEKQTDNSSNIDNETDCSKHALENNLNYKGTFNDGYHRKGCTKWGDDDVWFNKATSGTMTIPSGISLCKSNSKSQPTSTSYQLCNSGDSNISNEEICMEAAKELNFTWGNSYNSNQYKKGCVEFNSIAWFNTNQNPRNPTEAGKSICNSGNSDNSSTQVTTYGNCSSGDNAIKDLDTCKEAAQYLKKNFEGSFNGSVYKKGCTQWDNDIWFNTAKGETIDNSGTSICKK